MYGSKEYRMAQALLMFNQAFKELTLASKALPDMDVSQFYPFYLLDYEQIQPDVEQWCLFHASKIINQVPDRVPNSACAGCPWLYAGIGPDGLCRGTKTTGCRQYPEMMFTRAAATTFLSSLGVDTSQMDDAVLQMVYTQKVEEVNRIAKEKQSTNSAVTSGSTDSTGSAALFSAGNNYAYGDHAASGGGTGGNH